METSETPIFPNFEDESLFSALASHVSQHPLPGSGEAHVMTVGSGRQLSMLLDQSSPLGAFSKILLESSVWTNSEEYCYIWNRLDTKFALSAFQLTPLGPSTEDNGSSLWRTPNSAIVTGGGQDGEKRLANGHAMQLSDQAMTPKLWPTPTTRDYKDGTSESCANVPVNGLLGWAVHQLLPTPRAHKINGKDREDFSPSLHNVVGQSETSGSLNPRFVEELMGYPIDHTALKRSETPSFLSKPTRSSRRSRKSSLR